MARLIIEAVSNETSATDSGTSLSITVSVSLSDTGAPVTNLIKECFKITDLGVKGIANENADFTFTVKQRVWDPDDTALSGVYDIQIRSNVSSSMYVPWVDYLSLPKGATFSIGIQVKNPPGDVAANGRPAPVGQLMGQTVVSIVNV